MNMNISPVANDMFLAIDDFMNASLKTSYRFTDEERTKLEFYIKILQNHLTMLDNYELKREVK